MRRALAITAILFCSIIVSAQNGDWTGKIEVMGSSISLVFHIGDESSSLDVPEQMAKGIPVEKAVNPTGIVLTVPMIGARFEGIFIGNKMLGSFIQNGASFPITLKPGVPEIKRPQTPRPPFPYSTEEVEFRNGSAFLKGTLTLPQGFGSSTPLVVMVSGSGLQNRDEEIFEHKPFAVIADALARNGIASLRYDDRGAGESTGDTINCTTDDFRDDALEGVESMRGRFNKIGVLGHSEGGAIAVMLAAEGKVDFILSLAGAIAPAKDIMLWQNKVLLSASGYPESTVTEYCRALGTLFDSVIAGKVTMPAGDYILPAELKQNLALAAEQCKSAYMGAFLKMDMTQLLGKIKCPVFAINGTLDTQVPYETNLEALKNGLPKNSLHSINAIEGVNHLFQHCTTGLTSEYASIEETISPDVLDAIVRWINGIYNK